MNSIETLINCFRSGGSSPGQVDNLVYLKKTEISLDPDMRLR